MNPKELRKSIPRKIIHELMFRSRHTCCICRERGKSVQAHHIDGDRSNNALSNLTVLCLDCHSRVTSDEGLGRKFSPAEVTKYKAEWEARCTEQLAGPRTILEGVKKELIEAEMDRLMIQAAAVDNVDQRLEAVRQLAYYTFFFDVQRKAVTALHNILIMSCWSEADVAAECVDALQTAFCGLAGPEYVPMGEDDEQDLSSALETLRFVVEHLFVELESPKVVKSLSETLDWYYFTAAAYENRAIAGKILDLAELCLTNPIPSTAGEKARSEAICTIAEMLSSIEELNPTTWHEEASRIKHLQRLSDA